MLDQMCAAQLDMALHKYVYEMSQLSVWTMLIHFDGKNQIHQISPVLQVVFYRKLIIILENQT